VKSTKRTNALSLTLNHENSSEPLRNYVTLLVQCVNLTSLFGMCYYRLYIFLGCGHSSPSSMPVKHCGTATNFAKNNRAEEALPAVPSEGYDAATVESIVDHDVASPTDSTTSSRKSIPTAHLSQIRLSRGNMTPGSEKTMLQPCEEGRIHPLHTVRLQSICTVCASERDERLQALESVSVETRIQPKGHKGHYRGKSQGPSLRRESAASVDEHAAGGGWNVLGHRKVDSGVWTVGARWLRDWKGQG
jgi:hypothetical protein